MFETLPHAHANLADSSSDKGIYRPLKEDVLKKLIISESDEFNISYLLDNIFIMLEGKLNLI